MGRVVPFAWPAAVPAGVLSGALETRSRDVGLPVPAWATRLALATAAPALAVPAGHLLAAAWLVLVAAAPASLLFRFVARASDASRR